MNKARALMRLARPHHYIKNGLIFVPVFFAHRLFDPAALLPVSLGFAGFCMAAGAVYVFNDMVDASSDALHPLRQQRPLAAAALTFREARWFMVGLLGMALVCCLYLFNPVFFLIITTYVLLNLWYSLQLKRMLIVDVVCIAAGFLLRIFAGAAVIKVAVSPWLAGLTFSMALFLGFAKRRCDMDVCQSAGPLLPAAGYNQRMLTAMMIVLAMATLTGYVVYTLSPSVISEHDAPRLYWTVPWVGLGLWRYGWIVLNRHGQCYPVTVLWQDHWLQLIIGGWIVSLWVMIY